MVKYEHLESFYKLSLNDYYKNINYIELYDDESRRAKVDGYTSCGRICKVICLEKSIDNIEEHLINLLEDDFFDFDYIYHNLTKTKIIEVVIAGNFKCDDKGIVKQIIKEMLEVELYEEYLNENIDIVILNGIDLKNQISNYFMSDKVLEINTPQSYYSKEQINKFLVEKSDWIDNLHYKLKSVIISHVDEDKIREMIRIYVEEYICGDYIYNVIKKNHPMHYDKLMVTEGICIRKLNKRNIEAEEKDKILFQNVVKDISSVLHSQFENKITESMKDSLIERIINGWLLDCTMRFDNE